MTLADIGWLFTVGVLVHNAEEALWLPAWSVNAGRWHAPVGAGEFRFAVGALSAMVVVTAFVAPFSPDGGVPVYLMAGWALAMVLNVVFPHLLASVVMRKYMPGTATALLFNLPIGSLYLFTALSGHHVARETLAWAGPLIVAAIAGSIPLLFLLGRKLLGPARKL